MKNRIIASILAIVMTLLALVSCGSSFNFAEDSDDYATVDLAGFLAALKAVEIEDADFTTDEAVRLEKVKYNLLGTLSTAAVKEDNKKTEGSITANDVLYFCYYATYTEEVTTGEGESAVTETKTYYFLGDQMKTSTVTSGTTTNKATHVIEMAVTKNNEEDKYNNALYDALVAAMTEGKIELTKDNAYSVVTSKTDVKDAFKETNPLEIDSIVVSYVRTEKVEGAKQEKAIYETLVLNKDYYNEGGEHADAHKDGLVELLLTEGVSAKIGEAVSKTTTTGEGDGATTSTVSKFDIAGYEYSSIKVEWGAKNGTNALVSFKHTPYTTTKSVEPDNIHQSDAKKIDLKDKELTYYVFPVSYIEVPELNGATILSEIVAGNIKADSFKEFADEEYKNGETTAKALVEELVKIWSGDEETLKKFSTGEGEGAKSLYDLKKAWDDAQKTHDDDHGEEGHDHTALNTKITEAKEAYEDARKVIAKAQCEKIAAASKTVEGVAKTIGEAIYEQYTSKDGDVYKSLKSEYDSAIVDAVGKEVWKLVDKYVTIKSYPEKMVEEFYNHLYETYEYDFYKGSDSTSKKSNYLEYGSLENYLVSKELKGDGVTNADGIEAAITKRAENALKPILQVYALAIALDNSTEIDVTSMMKSYVEADKAGHAYDILDDTLTDKQRKEQEEAAEKSYQQALSDSENFIVTDKVFKEYKKQLGNATYRDWEAQYGEVNLRAALQSNRLMYFLLSTNIQLNADGDGLEVKYEEIDGKNYVDFRTVEYKFKAEETTEESK